VSEEPPTIYEWGAGREAFERWLNAFYDLVERDDLLSPLFGGRVSREHRRNVTTWASRLAVHNSQRDADVVEHAPVPRWVGGWRRRIGGRWRLAGAAASG
jgi:truncated hemoglobin YjbI